MFDMKKKVSTANSIPTKTLNRHVQCAFMRNP